MDSRGLLENLRVTNELQGFALLFLGFVVLWVFLLVEDEGFSINLDYLAYITLLNIRLQLEKIKLLH